MAVAATNLTTGGLTASQTSFTTASVSPTAGRLVLAAVFNFTGSINPNTPTLTGASMTWTQVLTRLDTATTRRLTIFRSLSTTPGSGTLTFDYAGQNQTSDQWSIVEFSGIDAGGTNGANAIVQSGGNDNSGTQTGITVTLAAFGSASNAAFGFVRKNTLPNVTVGSGFSEVGNYNDGTSIRAESEFKNSSDTTIDWTWGSESATTVAVAVEIKDAILNLDVASNSGYQAASSSYNWLHNCTGSNRYLAVGVSMLSLAQTVSGITYNSVAMTFLGAQNSVSGAARVELWGLIAPSTGSNSIAVTLTGSIASAACASSFTGVHQTSPTEGFNSNQATNVGAADATVNVTTIATNNWVVDQVATDDTAITVGSGQISRNNVTGAGGSAGQSTEGFITPAGAVTMSWANVAALATWSIAAIALRDINSSTLTATTNRFLLLGVG